MVNKKCPKCGGSWSSSLKLCAFCGVEGVEETAPVRVTLPGEMMQPEPPPAPEPEPEPAKEAEVAVETAPPPEPEAPKPEEPKAEDPTPEEAKPEEPEPEEPKSEEPAARELPADTPLRLQALQNLTPMPGPGPKLPFPKVGVVFGILGILACLVLPATVFFQGDAGVQLWLAKLGPLLSGLLAPFAAIAWIMGARHERKCREIDTQPQTSGRVARVLGIWCSIVFLFQISIVLIVVGILKLTGYLPPSFLGPHAG